MMMMLLMPGTTCNPHDEFPNDLLSQPFTHVFLSSMCVPNANLEKKQSCKTFFLKSTSEDVPVAKTCQGK